MKTFIYSNPLITEKWDEILSEQYQMQYFKNMMDFVCSQYTAHTVYPPFEYIFRAMKLADFNDIKVVILGQDPYHQKGQANGLAFAVNQGQPYPPSLQNIFKEVASDIGKPPQKDGTLLGWVSQGVLLLNTSLTVLDSTPMSHANIGWTIFTDAVIRSLNRRQGLIAYILWGNQAKAKTELIDKRHYITQSAHPSPLSCARGFFGSKPFSKVNDFLIKNNMKPIDWTKTCAD